MKNQVDSKKSLLRQLLLPSSSSKNLKCSLSSQPEISLSDFEATGETIFSGCLKDSKIMRDRNKRALYTVKTLPKYSLLSVQNTRAKIQKATILDHSNSLKIHFFLEDSSSFYIFYDYIPGNDLASEIIMEDGLSEEKCLEYFYEISTGLNFFHTNSIVLRHLSLENIYFDLNHKIQIALEFEDKIFNDHYVAPEGGRATFKSDIWCLGLIFCEMILGYLPESLSDLNTHLTVFASGLLHKLLNRNPAKRITANRVVVHSYFNKKLDQGVIIDRIEQRINRSINRQRKYRNTQSTDYTESISTLDDRFNQSKQNSELSC